VSNFSVARVAVLIGLVSAETIDVAVAKSQRDMTTITNANGQPQQVPKSPNFAECVANGIALGHPRLGPGGESDPRGAVGFCHRKFP
jgi:hypothetical protein